MVWVRLDAQTARELDQLVKREKIARKNRIDLRAMSRSTAMREALAEYLERYRAKVRAQAPAVDERQGALPIVGMPGIDQ